MRLPHQHELCDACLEDAALARILARFLKDDMQFSWLTGGELILDGRVDLMGDEIAAMADFAASEPDDSDTIRETDAW